jgi:hypothetical protein
MDIWSWLNANSGALQSILALVTICVLFITWGAIKIQADAARALTKVAVEQTQAALDAAAATNRQADLLASQLELSTAPLLVSELDSIRIGRIVVNRGLGTAFQVRYWQGTRESKNQGADHILFTEPSTLAPDAHAELYLPDSWLSWTICYKGSDLQERWTTAFRAANKPQEHVIRKGTQEILIAGIRLLR